MGDITINPGGDWSKTVKALKGADKIIRLELGKEIRQVSAPIVADMRSAIKGWDSVATSTGGGRSQRARVHIERSRKATAARAVAQKRLARGGFGLRDTIAKSLQTKISLAGKRQGVRIRVDTGKLGHQARSLPRRIDTGTWRHPVYGNRNAWVEQKGQSGWFSDTAARHLPGARRGIMAAMDKAMKKII